MNSNYRSSSVPRPRRGDVYDDMCIKTPSNPNPYYQNHLPTSTPSSLPLLPQSPMLSEIPLRKTGSMDKRRDSLGIFSTRGAPPQNIFAYQGGITNDYRSTPTELFSANVDTMLQDSRNPPDDYGRQASSRTTTYTLDNRQDNNNDYISRVSAEMRAGHRKTQEQLLRHPRFSSPSPTHRHENKISHDDRKELYQLEKQLLMKESELNELKRNNVEKEIAAKTAHRKKVDAELASKTSEIEDLKRQLESTKAANEENLKTKLRQQESKLLNVFKAELQECKEEMQAEQDHEIEAMQQELADALDEVKYLKKGCEFVEQEAKETSEELRQVSHQNEKILAEISQLKTKNEELATENELLTERYDNVLQEKIECERVTKELTEELEDKKQLERTVAEMEMEIQHLAGEQEAAKNHLEEAWGENNELRMRCIQLQKEMEDLREDNRLESQLNNKVKEQRDKIGDTVREKESEIEMLKERNEDLKKEMEELKNELLHTLDVASIYQKTHEIIKNDS